jgi:ribosomal protein S12 methylthiotransferase accessory factor
MTKQTFIKGKDRDLESTISEMQSKLAKLGFDIEEASWLNPVDNVYSVHIRDKSCPLMFTNGKGATKKACLASALGEYFERLSCNYFFADFYLGEHHSQAAFVHYPNERWFSAEGETMPEALLDAGLWNYFDPDKVLTPAKLFDLNSGRGERGVCALPYERLSDSKEIWFPVNVIANIFVSNGMSAGNTQDEARVQSLSEIFERYVKNKIIAEGICLPEVPDAVIKRFPQIDAAIKALRDHGLHLRIADASLGGVFPVMSVTLLNPKDGSVFASFGAHPCFEVALERTVTELLQGRDLDQLDVFQPAIFDQQEIASPQNLEMHFIDSSGFISYDFFKNTPDYEFADWNHDADTATEFAYLSALIHDLGFEIYIADYDHLSVYACRILVPGMSDIYPVDELEWENNNEGALFRADFLTLKQGNAKQWASILERLEAGGYDDATPAAPFIGLAPDPDTLWSTVRLGEIRMMLCLALQEREALDWVEWCLSLPDAEQSGERVRYLRCLQVLLEIKRNDDRSYAAYTDSLRLLFGTDLVETCLALVEGETVFYGLHCPGLGLSGFERHLALLAGYKKLQQAKIDV